MQATNNAAKSIRLAIEQKPAHINGLCKISPDDARIFYNLHRNNTASWLYLPTASAEQLQDLASACQPATFGRNSEDVLDESYRKALKMDTNNFAITLNPVTYGIIGRIQRDLLDPTQQDRPLKAELYKLNVYGEGSFFKAHKDTPRAEGMIGSLVVVIPTDHEGGSLLLRHGNNEWSFDSGSMLKESDKPSIAYVAFFSDVEHEVLPVTSGCRITLTWNLYLDENSTSTLSPTIAVPQSTFVSTLSTIRLDTQFMPKGGYLGFGLDYQYPVKTDRKSPTQLEDLTGRLKGSDAALLRSLEQAGFKAKINVAYQSVYCSNDYDYYDEDVDMDKDSGEEYDEANDSQAFIVSPQIIDLTFRNEEDPLLDAFFEEGGKLTYPYGSKRPMRTNAKNAVRTTWITQPKSASRFPTAYVAYGNQAELGLVYADLVILAEVPPATERTA